MAAEVMVTEATGVTKTAVKESLNLVKKAWSIMDAASEKQPPSDYLSPKAIQSIQGK
ncbi:MAG: hypothetical protein KJ069_27530 [Anaerolineae bacterium]|nr:hypothetical protein [Anaerolineae bacterium]